MKMFRHTVGNPIAKQRTTLLSIVRFTHRSKQGLLILANACLLLFVCGGFAPEAWPSQATQTGIDEPVAVVGGVTLYAEDYLPQIQGQIFKVRKQEYDLKRKGLDNVIDQRLLRAEAEKRGISEEELLNQEVDSKIADPTDAEIGAIYTSQKDQINRPLDQVRDQIGRQLKQAKVQQARQEYFQGLREQAGVQIYLLPPRVEVGHDPSRVRGNPDAKITIVEFSDFQCPFCLKAHATIQELLSKYGDTVKLAYRDFPLRQIHPDAHGAAEASRCAGEQGKFWEYHDLLFENQKDFGEETFQGYAEILELDAGVFTTCLESGKFQSQIQEDLQEGTRLGVTGTPGFFINGIPLTGAQPASVFEEIIDAELATIEQRADSSR